MGGWHLRMTLGQEVCYASLHSEPASALGLPTVWSLWGNLGMARCQEMSICLQDTSRSAKWHRQAAVGHLVSLCVKCCRMVDSVPRWRLSLSGPVQSDFQGRNFFMAKPSTFLESRSCKGHDCGKCINNKDVLLLGTLWYLQQFLSAWWKLYHTLTISKNIGELNYGKRIKDGNSNILLLQHTHLIYPYTTAKHWLLNKKVDKSRQEKNVV